MQFSSQPAHPGWLSKLPISIGGAFLSSAVAGIAIWFFCQAQMWTPLQRYYWDQYVKTETFQGVGTFRFLNVVDRHGHRRLATEADILPLASKRGPDLIPFALSSNARDSGGTALAVDSREDDAAQAHEVLARAVYRDRSVLEFMAPAFLGALGVLIGGLVLATRRRRAYKQLRERGRTLKGPQIATVEQFNYWGGADGIGFATTKAREMLCIPRSLESSHMMVMGDSGTGKSALLRQLLMQVAERRENAIVYDPALEYTPQFYDPHRGDLILNPLDTRCPYWSPADEITHEAEALTLATSLFPDKPRENSFFVEGPRKIFAYLLTLKPTPEKLVQWMSREDEIDQLVKGTELAAFVYRGAGPQRGGVLGALNMVADSLRLLPKQEECNAKWSSVEWAEQRKGWIFLTSTPRFRERLLPLTSLWLDTLVLRLMNTGNQNERAAWFVLDELASLQRLPQLHTALTENRKSNNPVVIGFQGRSQLEVRYGHEAEAMLSQPATKIFLHTSEPRAAKWISDTIGEVEIERVRESVSTDQFPRYRRSKSYNTERRVEPLVLPSEISGLPRLHALVKVDNFVVPISFPYIELAKIQPAFIERPQTIRQLGGPQHKASKPPGRGRKRNHPAQQELIPSRAEPTTTTEGTAKENPQVIQEPFFK